MGSKKKDVFKYQLKTVQDISERIDSLIKEYQARKGSGPNVFIRTVIDPNSNTLYKTGHHGRGGISKGIRHCDYKFSDSDPFWIIPSEQHGLSFSSTVKHAVSTMEFLGGFQKKGTKINCAYWIIENSEHIPKGMKFVQDPDNPSHYLLAVTERMTVDELAFKLLSISQRMAVMTDLQLEAYKNA